MMPIIDQKRQYFEIWKSECETNRIMENAFNKVLEMNHKHVSVRLSAAINLISRVIISHNKKMTYGVFLELCSINNSYNSVKSSQGDWYLDKKYLPLHDGKRSPIPKFSHSNNIFDTHISSSLKDSTIFLTRVQKKYKTGLKKRGMNKSVDNNSFLF